MTIEEMVETFIDGDGLQDVKSGLLAVIEKHVGTMIESGYQQGATFGRSDQPGIVNASKSYTAHVIAQLKGTQ